VWQANEGLLCSEEKRREEKRREEKRREEKRREEKRRERRCRAVMLRVMRRWNKTTRCA
jgi:hypothetical protein